MTVNILPLGVYDYLHTPLQSVYNNVHKSKTFYLESAWHPTLQN
jgi:hypothetical protein